ncbi:MAG: hypothetical protein EPO16_10025 [Dehalococcoidia bacterium]|nr:MAG: hypothetical protein EPO16_10025 [Dehalococcoidia bacterium]
MSESGDLHIFHVLLGMSLYHDLGGPLSVHTDDQDGQAQVTFTIGDPSRLSSIIADVIAATPDRPWTLNL